MSDLDVQLVREFFELNRFRVLTHWHHENLPRIAEAAALLFIEHASPVTEPQPGFVLSANEVPFIHRAVVEVRAWHGERFYPSVIESSAVVGHVAAPETRALAESVFETTEFTSILVLSELSNSPKQRERSVALLRDLGIGHILEFPTILQDILARITAYGSYAPSQTLQTLRLLKRYNFIRRQQLEFTFPTQPPIVASPPEVETEVVPEETEEIE